MGKKKIRSESIFDSEESVSSSKKKSEKSISSEKYDTKSVSFIKLIDDSVTEIRYVYHISDIHIHNYHRHAEYREVFNRTYQTLKTQIGSKKSSSLIVLTGDIVHAKTDLKPDAYSITQDFFQELSDIATVILIPGNHDLNVSNKDRMDSLYPMLYIKNKTKIDNIYYLKKSGIYQYYNIIFGVTSVVDDVMVNANQISTEIWKNVHQKNKFKIALYHGAVHGSKTDVGYRMNNDELIADDFNGYDYVMLGDIHKFQYLNEDKTIAYSGSLIQQSYGEALDNHGILKWDLIDKESELLEIKNYYGYCTIRIVNGEMIETRIPKKPRIRFILENTSQLQYQDILNKLDKEYQICEIVMDSHFKTKRHVVSPSQQKLKEEFTAFNTQEDIIKKYLSKKDLTDENIVSIIDLHKKIYQKVVFNKKEQIVDSMHNATHNQKWKILELQFSNMLSYGENNMIDFKKYEPNEIIGIVAPNHYGKSAILDILLFCLFDKFSRGDRRDILNKNSNKMYCSLLFRIGSQKYFIERIGQRSKNGLTVKIDVNFYLIHEPEDGKEKWEKLNGVDKNSTNDKIRELIGDYDDYLTTCFCLQQGKSTNFIDMTQQQKKEYLNDILKLNVFEDCYKIAKDKFKELSAQLKLLEQQAGSKSLNQITDHIKRISNEIKTMERNKCNSDFDIPGEMNRIIKQLSQVTLPQYTELSIYDLDSEDAIQETIESLQSKMGERKKFNIGLITIQLEEYKNSLKKLESDMEQYNSSGENNSLDILINQKDQLMKKIIHIPKDMESMDITELKKEKEQIHDRINIISNVLEEHKNQHLSEKMDRIDELKELIRQLRKSLHPINEKCEEEMIDIKSKYALCNEQITSMIENEFFLKRTILSKEEKDRLGNALKIKNRFVDFICKINNELESCDKGITEKNDLIISKVIQDNQAWIKKHVSWNKKVNELIFRNSDDMEKLNGLIVESSKLSKQMITLAIEIFYLYENQHIQNKISKAEEELDALSEFNGTKKEVDNLKREKNLLDDKISIINQKLEDFDVYQKHAIENHRLQIEIDQLQNSISQIMEETKNLTIQMKDLKHKIIEYENLILQHQQMIEEHKKISHHLKLLYEYQLVYRHWKLQNEYHQKWIEIKKNYDLEIAAFDKELDKKKLELAMYKKDIEQYMEIRKEFDQKSAEINVYQLYVQVMNCNGLPYEMLKTYLPLIESDVNQILHSMVNFNIEFVFYDESSMSDQKSKNIKTNMGCIDINICRQGMKPYKVQLVSGFERFIIGLAIRMTLCQISLTAKPNFLIIDEGWSCLDAENLNNVGTIMNYIKMQYEHIIIISHLDEIKNQARHVISIDRIGDFSYIKPEQKIITGRKKKSKIVEV